MKIIVATDGSAGAEAAIEQAASFSYPPNSEVRIITVVSREVPFIGEPSGLSREYFFNVENEADKRGRAIIEKAAAKLRELNPALEISSAVLVGSPKSAIVEEARRWQADLIVVGSHGLNFWERAFIGSISSAVASHAPCSVEIVRQHQEK